MNAENLTAADVGKRRLANDHHHEYRQRDEVAAPGRTCQQCGELLTDIDEPELCAHCIVVQMEDEA